MPVRDIYLIRPSSYHLYQNIFQLTRDNSEIYRDYFGIAMGGHRMSKGITELYNKMVEKYCEIEGLQPRFHVNKADVITERNKM